MKTIFAVARRKESTSLYGVEWRCVSLFLSFSFSRSENTRNLYSSRFRSSEELWIKLAICRDSTRTVTQNPSPLFDIRR